jgi:hypothetical protein
VTPRTRNLLLGAALVAAALAIYFPVTGYGIVNYDDDVYLFAPTLPEGLGAGNVTWAFTTFYHSNWHPLTWLSWMTEVELFGGVRPRVLHLGNVLLHAANGALLFAALLALTRKLWPSFLVAALFAVHPMHVESVAWISERKDVLCVFFGLWTLLAYARYAREPGLARGLGVAGCFALSLLAKPMLVTLPFVLLLLDYWPLARQRKQSWRPLVLEKLPLLALCAVSCVLTWQAQAAGGAIRSDLPLLARLANAASAYVGTLGKTFAPWNLAPLYPRPAQGPALTASAFAALGLALVSWNAWIYRTRFPYLWVGWAWFVGTLVPVVGLVPLGEHAMADRYAYWPHIGLFVALVFWLDAFVLETGPRARRQAAAVACALCVGVLGVLAWRQTHVWKDSETLWRYTLEVTRDNYVAHANLGRTLQESDPLEAQAHFGAALAINPEAFQPAPATAAPPGAVQSDR